MLFDFSLSKNFPFIKFHVKNAKDDEGQPSVGQSSAMVLDKSRVSH